MVILLIVFYQANWILSITHTSYRSPPAFTIDRMNWNNRHQGFTGIYIPCTNIIAFPPFGDREVLSNRHMLIQKTIV